MWDEQKTNLFNKIKAIRPWANSKNYDNMSYNQMLAIYQDIINRSNKSSKSKKKLDKKSNEKSSKVKPDKVTKDYADEEFINQSKNKDDYVNINKGVQKSFDIDEKEKENKNTSLEKIYDELHLLEDYK